MPAYAPGTVHTSPRNDAAPTAQAQPETASRNSSPPQYLRSTPAVPPRYSRRITAVPPQCLCSPPISRSGIAASARTAPQAIPPPTPGQHTAQKLRPGSLFENRSTRRNALFRYKKDSLAKTAASRNAPPTTGNNSRHQKIGPQKNDSQLYVVSPQLATAPIPKDHP